MGLDSATLISFAIFSLLLVLLLRDCGKLSRNVCELKWQLFFFLLITKLRVLLLLGRSGVLLDAFST